MVKSATFNFEFSGVVYPEDGFWLAHCLQLDSVGQGDTPESAAQEMIDLTLFHVREALRDNDVKSIFRPAPPEIWYMFYRGRPMKSPRPTRNGKRGVDDASATIKSFSTRRYAVTAA